MNPDTAYLLFKLNGGLPFSYATEYGNHYTIIKLKGSDSVQIMNSKDICTLLVHGYVEAA